MKKTVIRAPKKRTSVKRKTTHKKVIKRAISKSKIRKPIRRVIRKVKSHKHSRAPSGKPKHSKVAKLIKLARARKKAKKK